MLYAVSSGIHLFTFMVYFLILSQPITIPAFTDSLGSHPEVQIYNAPFGYNNPTFWNSFYVFYTFVAIALFYHGVRILYKFMHSLPDFEEEIDNTGYQTERIDRT